MTGETIMACDENLIELTACGVVDLLRRGEVTPFDCLDALEARVAAVDSAVNALPILCFERAREHARRLMQRPLGERGLLAGLPVPIKDLTDVAGVRTTYGSPIFTDFVPEASDLLVNTIEAEGGWSTASPIRRSSAQAATPSTRCLARRATHGIQRCPPQDRRAGLPLRSLRDGLGGAGIGSRRQLA